MSSPPEFCCDIDEVLAHLGLGELAQLAWHHRAQDLQSFLMHREAVKLLRADPTLVTKVEATLSRWMQSVDPHSRPLLERWAQIVASRDWDAVLAGSDQAQQLRQASPLAGLLPQHTRLSIIGYVHALRKSNLGAPAPPLGRDGPLTEQQSTGVVSLSSQEVLEAAREWHRLGGEGEALLGTSGWALLRSFGRVMSGNYSGQYVSALPIEEARRLLEALRSGERIPVHLMHRHRSGNYESSLLSLDDGELVMHYPDRSEPAR